MSKPANALTELGAADDIPGGCAESSGRFAIDRKGTMLPPDGGRSSTEPLELSELIDLTPLPPPVPGRGTISGMFDSTERAELEVEDLSLRLDNPFVASSLVPPPKRPVQWGAVAAGAVGALVIGAALLFALRTFDERAALAVGGSQASQLPPPAAAAIAQPTESRAAVDARSPAHQPVPPAALAPATSSVEVTATPAETAAPNTAPETAVAPKPAVARKPAPATKTQAAAKRVPARAPAAASRPTAATAAPPAKRPAPTPAQPATETAAAAARPELVVAQAPAVAGAQPQDGHAVATGGAEGEVALEQAEVEVEVLPPEPTRAEVAAGLAAVRGELAQCAGTLHGVAQIQATLVGATGRVSHALVEGKFKGTPAGSCMARELRKARFPRFSQPRFTVSAPMAF